jgi:probable rRNA maturation factor
MKIIVDIQNVCQAENVPDNTQFTQWVSTVLRSRCHAAELTIRIVDSGEITELNHTYRHKNYPTNILAFPADIPEVVELAVPLLGDLIICAPVMQQEALAANKPLLAHWAHLVIHGTLHLLGYDHQQEKDARIMESLEIDYLQQLGFADPYATVNS